MKNMTSYLSKTAKNRLIAAIDTDIEKFESSMGVSDQMNASNARLVRNALQTLTLTSAYKLEKAIMNAEYYDPTQDKYGFGPAKINPSDYLAFCDDAGIKNPVVRDADEMSRVWFD